MHTDPLPIEEVLPQVQAALSEHGHAVLQAPPGAGKTTRVPLALLEAPWRAGQRLLVLEPRRLATRAAAQRMAQLLGEPVGETVGYRMRLDQRVGPRTRIEVVTEGVLTRMLQSDPALEGVGLVVFDEFHERSLQADLGLALCLEARSVLREDLRLLVMSATLDGEAVARLLGEAPLITSAGRTYPVTTHHRAHRVEGRLEDAVAATVHDVLAEETGDVLVFLPGAGEIRRVAERLAGLPASVRVHALYGLLPQREQDQALAPSPSGQRKVVLATSIAETSLTIEGVRVVVDSGLMRGPRFDPGSGMTRLVTRPVTRDAADQRRGRAGRLGPGVCYRLWTRADEARLADHRRPEILEADLTPLALDLAAWGTPDPAALHWLSAPPTATYAQASDLLTYLGALDAEGRLTDHGRAMQRLGLHPRLAHMVLAALPLGLGRLACDVAALLEERDLLRASAGPVEADLRLRLQALEAPGRPGTFHGYTVHGGARHRVRQAAQQVWRRVQREDGADLPAPTSPLDHLGVLVAFAYPDRLAQREHEQADGTVRYRLRTGRRVTLSPPQVLSKAPFLAVADLGGPQREARIFRAVSLTEADLRLHFGGQIHTEQAVAWDAGAQAVRATQRDVLGALVLREGPLADTDPEAVRTALLEGIRQEGVALLPWTKEARQLQARIVFAARHEASLPDTSDGALLDDLATWLGPYVDGMRSRGDLQRLDLGPLLRHRLTWAQQQTLDAMAPSHLTVPSGSRIRLDYSDPTAPVLAVRLQELFGQTETPTVARGAVPLTVHLLSPAHRPVQVTQDLAGFWATSYFDVRKDMRGRYPKHPWPEDPLSATPTRRAKRRKG
ncbi:MAG: ATP-dependent helicase HrpB [Bacteroidota bacterium]